MARIKIEELPVMEDMDAQETKGIFGGGLMIENKPWSRRGRKRGRFAGFGQRGYPTIPNRGLLGGLTKPGAKAGGGQKGFTGLE